MYALDRYSRTGRLCNPESRALHRVRNRARAVLEWMQRNRDYAAVLVAMAAGVVGLFFSALQNI